MIGLEMMAMCAPHVAPETLIEVIQVESGGNPIAVNINSKWTQIKSRDGTVQRQQISYKSPISIQSVADAVTVSNAAIKAGFSVDMGYMQVNSSNLKALGYSVNDMFEPCKNLAAGARVLSAFYGSALRQYKNEQVALRAALSAYNTGDFKKGFINGYLARYGLNPSSKTMVNVPALNPYTADSSVDVQQLLKQGGFMSSTNNKSGETNLDRESKGHMLTNDPLVSQSKNDASTPGVQVEYTADEAQEYGAFSESALSEKDAWDSNADVEQSDNANNRDAGGRAALHNGHRGHQK